jgi:rod shape-determining protein MreB
MLGFDVVFGNDCFEHRLALDLVRPFAKGALKYVDHVETGLSGERVEKHREAARLIVRHAVSRTQPAPGLPIYGVVGAPSRATMGNKQIVMDAARDAFDAVVIVPEPFCIAYGMNRLTNCLVIDIGAGTTDLCPMNGTYPSEEDQVTIPVGGDAIDAEFCRLLASEHPDARVSLNMARKIKEKYGFVHDLNERVLVALPTADGRRQFDLTDTLKEACKIIVPLIIDGLKELMSRVDPEFHRSLLDDIILGGGGSQLKGLDRLIETALETYGGGNVTKVYDSVFAGAVGALKLAMAMPAEQWSQLQEMDREARQKMMAAAV